MTQEYGYVKNRFWLKQTFNVTIETKHWLMYRCTLCDWTWVAQDSANRQTLEGRLALHLVDRHVDFGELLVG